MLQTIVYAKHHAAAVVVEASRRCLSAISAALCATKARKYASTEHLPAEPTVLYAKNGSFLRARPLSPSQASAASRKASDTGQPLRDAIVEFHRLGALHQIAANELTHAGAQNLVPRSHAGRADVALDIRAIDKR